MESLLSSGPSKFSRFVKLGLTPPDFEERTEWEKHYGAIPPQGLDASLPYIDNEIEVYYSSEESTASSSTHEFSAEEVIKLENKLKPKGKKKVKDEEGANKDENQDNIDDMVDFRRKVLIRHQQPRKVYNSEEDEEFELIFGAPAGDGELCAAIDYKGNVKKYKQKPAKLTNRRISKVTTELKKTRWSYEQKMFNEEPIEHLSLRLRHAKNELLQGTKCGEYRSDMEKAIANAKQK